MGNRKRISFETIQKAKAGDSDAVEQVMKFYGPMIDRLCSKECTDKEGRRYKTVDESVKDRIISKLLYQIIYKYEIGREA